MGTGDFFGFMLAVVDFDACLSDDDMDSSIKVV
jgi:hypothetical protein